jgi:hypothetical protein
MAEDEKPISMEDSSVDDSGDGNGIRLEGESIKNDGNLEGLLENQSSSNNELVSGHNWAWYMGIDPSNGYHVFKLFALRGEAKFNEITIGFTTDEYKGIMKDPTKEQLRDPYLLKHRYLPRMKEEIEAGNGAIVRWDRQEYNLWRSKMDDDEGENSRVYVHQKLEGKNSGKTADMKAIDKKDEK